MLLKKKSFEKFYFAKSNSVYKTLFKKKKMQSGRSSIHGHITVRHKGSGCKTRFRSVNFENLDSNLILLFITYDPFRTSFISFVFNILTKSFDFILSTDKTLPGSLLYSGKYWYDGKLGYSSLLYNLPSGVLINSLSKLNYAKAAGVCCQLLQKNKRFTKIKLPSNRIINVTTLNTWATLGVISNKINKLLVKTKAGNSRLRGVRPSVRGIAMNPVDHPHGGRTNGGIHPKTPWGLPATSKSNVKKKPLL